MWLKYFLLVAIALVGTYIFLVGQGDGNITTHAQERPIYSELLEIMQNKEMPNSLGEVKSLFPTQLSSIDWDFANIYPFYAKTSENGTIFYFSYFDTTNHRMLVYTHNGKEVNIDGIKPDVSFVSNTELPQIILWKGLDSEDRVKPKLERFVTADINNNKLTLTDIDKSMATDFLSVQHTVDYKEQKVFIVSPVQEKAIHDFSTNHLFADKKMLQSKDKIILCFGTDTPYKYKMWAYFDGEWEDEWDKEFKDDGDGRQYVDYEFSHKKGLYNGEKELYYDSGIAWYTLDVKTNKWSTLFKLGDFNSQFLSLVPENIKGIAKKHNAEIRLETGEGAGINNPIMWKDGSVIVTIKVTFKTENEDVCFEGLVKIPQDGAFALITWTMRYRYFGENTIYNRLWHPITNGEIEEIENGYRYTDVMKYYDTDFANDSIIYLINGRPWQIIME